MVVRWDGSVSQSFRVSNGVRQGSLISPHLFALYLDELSKKLDEVKAGCVLGTNRINHLIYADDAVVFSPSVSGRRALMKVCEKYGIENDIIFKPIKFAIMIFGGNKGPVATNPEFCMNGTVIPQVKCNKYLGHMITHNLRDSEDIERQRKKIYQQVNLQLYKKVFRSLQCRH